MPKIVIEIPEELKELGEAFQGIIASVRGTVARTRGGKAVDYRDQPDAEAEESQDQDGNSRHEVRARQLGEREPAGQGAQVNEARNG